MVICTLLEVGRELLFIVVSRSMGGVGLSVDRWASIEGRIGRGESVHGLCSVVEVECRLLLLLELEQVALLWFA